MGLSKSFAPSFNTDALVPLLSIKHIYTHAHAEEKLFLFVLSLLLLYYMAAHFTCVSFFTPQQLIIRYGFYYIWSNVQRKTLWEYLYTFVRVFVSYVFSSSFSSSPFSGSGIISFHFIRIRPFNIFVLFYYHTIHAFALNPYLCIILYNVYKVLYTIHHILIHHHHTLNLCLYVCYKQN